MTEGGDSNEELRREVPDQAHHARATNVALVPPPELVQLGNLAIKTLSKVDDTKLEVAKIRARTAEKMLTVSQADTRHDREHEAKAHTRNLIFAGAVITLAMAFGVYGIERGLEDVVADLIKFTIGAVLGAFGGWGLRGYHEKRAPAQLAVPDDDDDD